MPQTAEYQELEAKIRDLRRLARLNERVLHQAVGELSCADGKITELPDLQQVEQATLLAQLISEAAEVLERLYDVGYVRRHET